MLGIFKSSLNFLCLFSLKLIDPLKYGNIRIIQVEKSNSLLCKSSTESKGNVMHKYCANDYV